jgi:hypothetical protein
VILNDAGKWFVYFVFSRSPRRPATLNVLIDAYKPKTSQNEAINWESKGEVAISKMFLCYGEHNRTAIASF